MWAKSSDGRLIRCGVCPEEVNDNTIAEMFAIYGAISVVVREWPQTTKLLICSDAQPVLNMLRNSRYNGEKYRYLGDKIAEQLGGRKALYKWVKAHTNSNDTWAYVNRMCDQLARDVREQEQKRRAREWMRSATTQRKD